MTRDPADVIDAVLAHVPAERTALRAELEQIARDSAYLAPEAKRAAWVALMKCLQASCSLPPAAPWEVAIARIVAGETVVTSTPGGDA